MLPLRHTKVCAILCLLALLLPPPAAGARAQVRRGAGNAGPQQQKTQAQAPARAAPTPRRAATPEPAAEAEESAGSDEWNGEEEAGEVERVETNLVSVPVVVSDRDDRYVPDMRREEFSVYEDGVPQQVTFFAAVSAPFHVVLMIDTSASTQEKLGLIQRAAISFVEQLQPGDRVKVVSFDDKVRHLSDFTGDRAALAAAINRTRPGRGTKLYDAMQFALGSLRRVEGRKAVVIFTDGVDWRSDRARYDDNVRQLEEAGVIVYPIRYDTREETERIAREQARGAGQRADLGSVLGGGSPSSRTTTPTTMPGGSVPMPEDEDRQPEPPSSGRAPRGTTPTTVPGGEIPLPGSGRRGGISIGGLPLPPIVITPREDTRRRGGGPVYDPNTRRGGRTGSDPWPDEGETERGAGARFPGQRRGGSTRDVDYDDSISRMLDLAYETADGYLKDLALKSGGTLHRADTLDALPEVFARIASELRTQYWLGYTPLNRARDGRFRKVQVRTARKNVSVRARPGYRAPKA